MPYACTVAWGQRNRGGITAETLMKLGHPALKINHYKAHSLLDRRYTGRVPIRYRISYSREEGTRIITGARALKDLSTTGCKILGAASIPLGSRLTLPLDRWVGSHVPHQHHGLPARQRLVCRQIPQTATRRTEAAARGDLAKCPRVVLGRSTDGIPHRLPGCSIPITASGNPMAHRSTTT
jgi:hypothetical protein